MDVTLNMKFEFSLSSERLVKSLHESLMRALMEHAKTWIWKLGHKATKFLFFRQYGYQIMVSNSQIGKL